MAPTHPTRVVDPFVRLSEALISFLDVREENDTRHIQRNGDEYVVLILLRLFMLHVEGGAGASEGSRWARA